MPPSTSAKADVGNPFSKVEKGTKDGFKIERMHYPDNNLGEARQVFAAAIGCGSGG